MALKLSCTYATKRSSIQSNDYRLDFERVLRIFLGAVGIERRAAGHALEAQGLAIVLSEQNLSFAQAVADRAVVIEQGRIVHEATMAELAGDASARQRYLSVA